MTEERWRPGQVVALTLQGKSAMEKFSKRPISLQARAVRWGEDGVGMRFVLPEGRDSFLWEQLHDGVVEQIRPADFEGMVRNAEARAFLSRICPNAEKEVLHIFSGGVGHDRVASAVELVLKAENLLGSALDAGEMRAAPRLVAQIVEDGSRAEEDWVLQFWGGLLASCCTVDSEDESNAAYINLLDELAATHVRIFMNACMRATKFVGEGGRVCAEPLISTMDEIVKISESRQMLKIERDLDHLAALGLVEKTVWPPSFLLAEEANLTPTSLGLEFNARCSGHRGDARDFYGVVAADAPASE
ncbi:MAG: hypothetical protein ABR956_16600 [Terracidiphilus sp.]